MRSGHGVPLDRDKRVKTSFVGAPTKWTTNEEEKDAVEEIERSAQEEKRRDGISFNSILEYDLTDDRGVVKVVVEE